MAIDLTKPEGSRLTSLKVRTNCDGPSKNEIYEELNDEKLYSITTMTYLSSGKDGYDILKTAKINYTTGDLDTGISVLSKIDSVSLVIFPITFAAFLAIYLALFT